MPKMAKSKRRIIIIILATIIGIPLFLFYGPFPQFRLLWINTAIYSSRHQFLASALYTQSYIEKILNVPFPQGQTDGEPLLIGKTDAVIFAPIKGDHFRGYIIKLEDPHRLTLVKAGNEEGEFLEDLVAAQQGLGGINGGATVMIKEGDFLGVSSSLTAKLPPPVPNTVSIP
jgi:hypothetical protein